MDLLHAKSITKRFGGLVAVNAGEITMPQQSIVSLIGPNGAGKTTFFNIIAGIYDPTAGRIDFNGRQMIARPRRAFLEPVLWVLPPVIVALLFFAVGSSNETIEAIGAFAMIATLMFVLLVGVARPPAYERLLARLGIFKSARPNDMVVAGLGRTFQNIRLFQNMTAMENVLVGMPTKLRSTWIDALLSTPRDQREEAAARVKAREFLPLVGLKGRDDMVAKNLPYGDQRRLEIARALASTPVLLLLDEPTAGMNPRETLQLTNLIGRLRTDLGL